jgi:hypothetical protein
MAIKSNVYALYVEERGRHLVKAFFRDHYQIVFEGISHKECVRYCHSHGVRMMDEWAFKCRTNVAFVKKNAKHPYREEDFQVAKIAW